MFSAVNKPCFRALLFFKGAPLPAVPPCSLHRFLPLTAGARHGSPPRVLAPHRGAKCMLFTSLGWVILVKRFLPGFIVGLCRGVILIFLSIVTVADLILRFGNIRLKGITRLF